MLPDKGRIIRINYNDSPPCRTYGIINIGLAIIMARLFITPCVVRGRICFAAVGVYKLDLLRPVLPSGGHATLGLGILIVTSR